MNHLAASPFLTSLARELSRLSWPDARLRAFVLRNAARIFSNKKASFEIGSYKLIIDVTGPFHRLMPLRAYDPPVERIIESVLRPGDTYVDVGAEIGYFAAIAGSQIGSTGRLVAFEPDPHVYPILESHLKSCGVASGPSAYLHQAACSDRKGTQCLLFGEISGKSRIPARDEVEGGQAAEIATVRLDQVLSDHDVQSVRLLKMDIEGHEIQALRGMRELLELKRIDFVLVEKYPPLLKENGYTAFHLHAFLEQNGYVGLSTTGLPIMSATLNDPALDNYVYARDASLLLELFPGADPGKPFVARRVYAEALDAGYPGRTIEAIIARASRGEIGGAVEDALALLRKQASLTGLRGHCAHWLELLNRREEARRQFEIIVSEEPDNTEARERLARLA